MTKVADLLEEIARDKAIIAKQGKLTGNGIGQHTDASPRVENSEAPRLPNMLVVVCPPVVVASKEIPKHPMPFLPNYMTKEQPEEPVF